MCYRCRENAYSYREPSVQKFGISTALVTPFTDAGGLDIETLRGHIRSVLALGADGVTLFGTTGEGASVSDTEVSATLKALTPQDIGRNQITLAIYATSVGSGIAQIQNAANHGVTRILLPPPFYFKDVGDDAVFEWYDAVLAGCPVGTQVILYHIPQITMVSLSLNLIQRLHSVHPAKVFAVKDSAGAWEDTKALLDHSGVAVLVGDERQLAAAAKLGCAGSISGLANVYPDRLKEILKTAEPDPALDTLINAVVANPVTAAVKFVVSEHHGNPAWRRVRAPLTATPDTAFAAIRLAYAAMPTPAGG